MKRTIYLLAIIVSLICSSCNSSKQLSKGNYDNALEIAVKKLQKNRNDAEQQAVLKEAYPAAQGADKMQIDNLNEQGSPDRWPKIMNLYQKMDRRQNLVFTVLPCGNVNFNRINYQALIKSSRENAGKYHWNNAVNYSRSGYKVGMRSAFYELEKAENYLGSNIDSITNFKNLCYEQGRLFIKINVECYSNAISRRVANDVAMQTAANATSHWIQYYSAAGNSEYTPDMNLKIYIENITLSLPQDFEREETFTREIIDGKTDKLDQNGKPIRDASGKNIKVDNVVLLKCKYHEIKQYRKASMAVSLIWYNKEMTEIVLSKHDNPLVVYEFSNIFAECNGDTRALPEELKPFLANVAVVIPYDNEMIANLCITGRTAFADMIKNNEDDILDN